LGLRAMVRRKLGYPIGIFFSYVADSLTTLAELPASYSVTLL